jgi:hypothetical protein
MPFALFVNQRLKEHITYYEVNWDSVVDKFNGRMRIGIVVQDYEGYVHAARSMTRLGNLERATAESIATFHASCFYKELCLQRILLEGDTLKVVKNVSFNVRNWSRFE